MKTHPTTLFSLAFGLAALTIPSTALAQEPPLNMMKVSNFDQSGQSYADVWGDGDYAYLAHFGQSRVDIIDISDPAAPQLAATYNSGTGSAQDVKVANGLMFVGLESSAIGIHIVDVRDPENPVKLTNVTVRSAVHNLFYSEGWLYIVDSSAPIIDIVDLRGYDPDNAPATISDFTYRVTGVGSFVHDITVQGGFLFAAGWNSMRVFDVSNIANQAPVFLTSVSGSAAHSSWATDDLRFLVTAEERTGGGLKLYEMVQTSEPSEPLALSLVLRDTFALPTSRASSVHNPVIRGYTVYTSWYGAGVQIFEIDPVLARFSLTASFDTTASGSGCWGVYPFLGDDRILASDINTGLWVLDADLASAPTLAVSGSCPGTVTVNVTGASPNAEVGVVSAANLNGYRKGGSICNGTLLSIGEPFVLPPTFVTTDSNGNGSNSMTLQSGSCQVEAIDLTSCRTSDVVNAD